MLMLRCFGAVAVLDDTNTEITLRSRKHLGLLLYLVAHPRTSHSRDELAYLFWEGADKRARHSLSQALYDIRANVGPILDVDTNSVRLLPERVTLEVEDLELALREHDHEAALELYRGEFAPNLLNLGAESFDRWLDSERERCRVLAALALRNAQRAAEERGNWDRMCLAALRLIKLNEFDEEAHCALMRGLWLKGDPASALAHYQSIRRRLDTVSWRSLQTLADRVRESGSVNAALTTPRMADPLTARGQELLALQRELDGPARALRIVVVAGEPGVGKTALLRELACAAEVRGKRVCWVYPGTTALSEDRLPAYGVLPNERRDLCLADLNVSGGSLENLRSFGGLEGGLVVVTTREALAARSCEGKGGCDSLLILDRLGSAETRQLIASHLPDCSEQVIQLGASMSAGNPALAIELARALPSGIGDIPKEADGVRQLIQSALGSSIALATLVQSRIDELAPEELRVARLLAGLSVPAARVARVLVVDEPWQTGVVGLRARGWLREADDGIELAVPLLAMALGRDQSTSLRRDREWAVERLSKGSPTHGFAAAVESLRLGDRDSAEMLATRSAQAALEIADRHLASEAATFAFAHAVDVRRRLSAGLLAAEAELGRGCPSRAEYILHDLIGYVDDAEGRVQVHSGLARAALEQRDWLEADKHANELNRLATRIGDVGLAARAELQSAHLTLEAEQWRGGAGALPAAASLELALRRHSKHADTLGDVWVLAARDVIWYRACSQSRVEAEGSFRTLAPRLAEASANGAVLLSLISAALRFRGAQIDSALKILRRTVAARGEAEGRPASVAMNNLAIALLEVGDLETARHLLARVQELDEALQIPRVDQVHSAWNHAQCLFYGGEWAKALSRCDEVLAITDETGMRRFHAQALGLTGLCQLHLGELNQAIATGERLDSGEWEGPYLDDQYLIHWLRAALMARTTKTDTSEMLRAEAAKAECFDELGALKLRVLAARALGGRATQARLPEDVRRLRAMGSSLFDRMATRFAPGNEVRGT